MMNRHPYTFDEFFASGREESISPFLTPSSRHWGKNLALKSAFLSAFLLLAAFITGYYHEAASSIFLAGVYFLCGTPALIDAIDDLKNLEINIDVLMTLAALLSVVIGSGMEGGLLLVLFEISAAMEAAVGQKTKSALISLHQLAPRVGLVIGEGGVLVERSVKDIAMGTRLLVRAGEVVPLDGTVVDGSSFVNLVHLTGESAPIAKKIGDPVPAGARNLDGTLTVSVTRTNADSTLARIIQLITQAQEAKPALEKFLDQFGKKYALTIILLFFLFAGALPLVFAMPYLGFEGSVYQALTFLIAASPCALILATPTAYLSAISSCARKGMLLKGGVIFDALTKCHTIAFDKTGTLTTGKLVCTSVTPLTTSTYDPKIVLSIAAALERHAVHPIAEAITDYAKGQGAAPFEIEDFRSVPGHGLEGVVTLPEGKVDVAIGHRAFIETKFPLKIAAESDTLLLVGNSLYAFQFIDSLRPGVKALIQELKKTLHPIMLTGDHLENAQEVARAVGIDTFFAHLRPEDKLAKVEAFSEKEGLIMVGDGVNDAPSLSQATVGISLGKIGSATAIDASDVVFLQDDLDQIPWLLEKARKTTRILKQNLTLALIVILFATTPALLGYLPIWVAVILHEGGTLLVGLNSLRLLRS